MEDTASGSTPDFKCIMCSMTSSHAAATGVPVHPIVRGDEAGQHRVIRCAGCGLVQLHPHTAIFEEDKSGAAYYEKDSQTKETLAYTQQKLESLLANERLDNENRVRNVMAHGLSAVLASLPAGRPLQVLDIGGYCSFSCALRRVVPNADITVLEPSVSRTRVGAHREPAIVESLKILHVYCDDTYADAHEGQYDLVTCVNVMEHVPCPREMFETAFRCVAPGGLVYFETPNQDNDLLLLSPGFSNYHYMIHHIGYYGRREYERLVGGLRQRFGNQVGGAELRGWQRYSLSNYMYWIGHLTPQPGGSEFLPQGSKLAARQTVPPVEQAWANTRETNCTSDAIFVAVQRTKQR